MCAIASRRDLLAGLSKTSASLLLGGTVTRQAAAQGELSQVPTQADSDALLNYFAANARKLLREPQGVLRYPSISPSLPHATYASSLWDWDTLWTVRGLFRVSELKQDNVLSADVAAHARGSLMNFFDHQSSEGRIPMLINVDQVDPLGCLTGRAPHKENQAKPVMAQLALLIAEKTGDYEWFRPLFGKLNAFLNSWRSNNLNGCGLLVWGDDVAIGNDNDPTTFGRPFFSSANLLLNCLYVGELHAASVLASKLGRATDQQRFRTQADALEAAVQQHCWDPRDRFFYTADVQCMDRRAELIPNMARGMGMSWSTLPVRIQTFTGFLPMWCGIATPGQSAELVRHLANPRTFAGKSGVRSLSAEETMYSLEASSNPSNWLGPVWIIVNYLVWSGLVRQGYKAEASALAAQTTRLLARDLQNSGSLNEYYHPDSGEALSHKGFMDWNLLVLEMI